MIGYHYTSDSCWASIQENGLVPYALPAHVYDAFPTKPKVCREMREKRPPGIFVWTRELTPLEHVGSLFYQAHKKRTNFVAVLSVEYEKQDAEISHNMTCSLKHWFPEEDGKLRDFYTGQVIGNSGDRPFWHVGVPATLLFRVIPKERVKLLDLIDLGWRLRLERPDRYVNYPAYQPGASRT